MTRRDELFELARRTRGFMPDDEGEALYLAGLAATRATRSWLEIGAWCGKSALYLGAAAEAAGAVLFSLDHHHGSEEHQAGWEHFDADLLDPADGRLNTLPTWQRTIADARLEETVIGLLGHSSIVAAHFAEPLDLLFIDGGHGEEIAWADYTNWSPKIVAGGTLAIHDVFADPADGGHPPYEIYQAALASGEFVDASATGSLRVVTRR